MKLPWQPLRSVAVAGLTFLAVVLVWNLFHTSRGVATAVENGRAPVAPGFALDQLTKPGTVRLDRYAGRLVVLAFWASWCEPCKAELPALERIWQRYRSGPVVIIGLDSRDSRSDAAKFVARHHLSFPTAIDASDATLDAYGVSSLPELFIISPAGHVVEHHRGALSPSQIEAAIRRHL